MFIVTHREATILFDCTFDAEIGDYPDHYSVYLMPRLSDGQLAGPWSKLPAIAIKNIASIAVEDVEFDETKRHSIESSLLDRLLES